ncbi:hypothetical protein D3C71_1645540 [compost metagenome]
MRVKIVVPSVASSANRPWSLLSASAWGASPLRLAGANCQVYLTLMLSSRLTPGLPALRLPGTDKAWGKVPPRVTGCNNGSFSAGAGCLDSS